jgi:threonine synthase
MRAALAAELGRGQYVDISTFFEPGRLEGKKTMGFEIMGHAMLAAVRESGGHAQTVSEPDIERAFSDLGRFGSAAGYESAATLAALRDARRSQQIAVGARVLLLLTGSHSIALAGAARFQIVPRAADF